MNNVHKNIVCTLYVKTWSVLINNTNLRNSTLLKKINKDINDPTIKDEFLKWDKSNGSKLAGLSRRRKAEAELYFTK